jgi:hypothetical protein
LIYKVLCFAAERKSASECGLEGAEYFLALFELFSVEHMVNGDMVKAERLTGPQLDRAMVALTQATRRGASIADNGAVDMSAFAERCEAVRGRLDALLDCSFALKAKQYKLAISGVHLDNLEHVPSPAFIPPPILPVATKIGSMEDMQRLLRGREGLTRGRMREDKVV